MKIHVFETADDVSGGRFIARVWVPMIGRGGKAVPGWHPVIAQGETEASVRLKVELWWEAERAKFAGMGAKGRKSRLAAAAGGEAHEVDFGDVPLPVKAGADEDVEEEAV